MFVLMNRLWRDDAGFVLSSELMLIATIVVLSVIVGLSEVSLAVNSELNDVANAFGAVNQGFNAGNSQNGLPGNGNQSNIAEISTTPPQSEQ